ncbi:MAG: trehalose-6-phosphate synthase [Acidobacteriota bacterium]|nr:trehalose-6-phosphate synthase [Acidobacteriota bacterium]
MQARSKLLVVSNRGPINFVRADDGSVQARRGAGGLIVTLGPGAQRDGALWLAAATTAAEREGGSEGPVSSGGFNYLPVAIEPDDYRAYYDVVANQTLWFCLHGLWDHPRRPRFDRHWWEAWGRYRAANEAFAMAVCEAAGPDAAVLVQDYQLALVPALVKARRPDIGLSTFLHTPWCSPQELRTLPDEVRVEVLSGLAGGGPVGFHTSRWAEAFAACCHEELGHPVETFVAPAGTDRDDLTGVAGSDACGRALQELDEVVGDRQLIVRVDRIEPSKNVLRGFWAFDELLESRPDLRGRVVFAAMVYPSRVGLSEYQAYGQEVLSLADRVNEKWATPGWTPVLVDPADDYPRSVAALRRYDVLLVNPVRDGMNLVAKEGPLVNQRDGTLVLSHEAGAWAELSEHAFGVNPFDVTHTAAALEQALEAPADDRRRRAAGLKVAAGAITPLDWFDRLLEQARRAHPAGESAG